MSTGTGFSCGLTANGTAYCWGLNNSGQLGDASTLSRLLPKKVTTDQKFAAIASGATHTCGITIPGFAYCWGSNGGGNLGSGSVGTNSLVPAAVNGSYGFVSIAAGVSNTCATTPERDVYCWGSIAYKDNFGTALAPQITLQPLRIGLGMVAVVGGIDGGYCTVDQAGLAYCWELVYTSLASGSVVPPINRFRPICVLQRFVAGLVTYAA